MPSPSESAEAKALATYLNALVEYKQITAYTKVATEIQMKHSAHSWSMIMKNKAMGVQKGIPDYVILAKDKIIFLELKKQKGKRGGLNGSHISEEQQLWIDTLNNYQSKEIVAVIAHGADEAIAFIKEHI